MGDLEELRGISDGTDRSLVASSSVSSLDASKLVRLLRSESDSCSQASLACCTIFKHRSVLTGTAFGVRLSGVCFETLMSSGDCAFDACLVGSFELSRFTEEV